MAGVTVVVEAIPEGWSIIVHRMVILALDTTTRAGSCALLRDGQILGVVTGDASLTQAARVPGDLMRLLDGAGATLTDVDLYAVATGPGSFTSLRVGIAAMQGLAFAGGRALIGVSTLDALAAIAFGTTPTSARRVACWVDAWRGEVFAAVHDGSGPVGEPTVASPEAVLADLDASTATSDTPTFFIGDGVALHRATIGQRLGARAHIVEPVTPALAPAIAALAADAANAGHRPPPHAIRALYVRRPDAELVRARAQHG